ncbi:MAG TPA: helix-turn-helix domain-containing protein [Flavisolibacter sp.]
MSAHVLQVQLFQYLKNKLPADSSLVDEISKVLGISTDSAYRRIRGEKPLSLEEVYKLCLHYQVSLDNLLNLQTDAFLFTGKFVQADSFRFDEYLTNIGQQVKYMTSFKERKMYYLCKDIPIFHHFHYREIAAFKYYFWMKNILHIPDFAHKKFSMSIYPDEFFELGKQTLHFYTPVDSVELWNIESVNSTLRQVEYYHDSNIFANEGEIYVIYDALEKTINHLEQQATLGYKFDAHDPDKKKISAYEMYFNEIIIMENSILVQLDGTKAAFLVHNVLNFMLTRDVRFCDNMYSYIQNLVKKSTLISTVSERERARFFKYLRQKIAGRKQSLKV